MNFLSKNKLRIVVIFILSGSWVLLCTQILKYCQSHNLLHLRWEDDLVFHQNLYYQKLILEKGGFFKYLLYAKPVAAYGAIFWFLNIIFLKLLLIFNENLLIASPMLLSSLFLILGGWQTFLLYEREFKDQLIPAFGILLIFLCPAFLMAGMRFHNYSILFFLSIYLVNLIQAGDLNNRITLFKILLASCMLCAVKLSGGLVFTYLVYAWYFKTTQLVKPNLKRLFWVLFVYIFLTLFFVSPNFFYLLTPGLHFKTGIGEFLAIMQKALAVNPLSMQLKFYAFFEHYFGVVVSSFLMISGCIWFKKSSGIERKTILIMTGVILLPLVYLFFFVKTASFPTYFIGIIPIFLLYLKGLEKLPKSISYLVLTTLLFFSAYNLKNNVKKFKIINDDFHETEFRLFKRETDRFLNTFKGEIEDWYCLANSICPWIGKKYFGAPGISFCLGEEHVVDGKKYLFVSTHERKNLRCSADQEKLLVSNLIEHGIFQNVSWELIYQSDVFFVFKRKE